MEFNVPLDAIQVVLETGIGCTWHFLNGHPPRYYPGWTRLDFMKLA
jgi:hypothetical protein